MIGFRCSGKGYQHYLLAQIFVFALHVLLPLRRCPFYMSAFFGSHAPLVFPSSLFLPSKGRDGGGRSRDALVLLPEGFPPPARLWSSGRGGGASGRAFGARELASVSSVHSWTRDSGVALLRQTPATCSVPVGSPSSSLHARRGMGRENLRGLSLFSVASPASSLHARRGGGAGVSSECRSS